MKDLIGANEEFLRKDLRSPPPYKVQPGDTLHRLAMRFYRREIFASCIASFNELEGPDAALQVNQMLKLPTVVYVHLKGGKSYSADFAPEGPIEIGLFFDGTNNSMLNDHQGGPGGTSAESNVAKLFYLYPQDGKRRFKAYIRGVGIDGGGEVGKDSWLKSTGGAGFGWHFEAKIALAMLYLKERVKTNAYTKYVIDVFGFSRGAAEARHFLTCLWRPEFHALLGVFADHIEVRFVGIFDTVAAVGAPPLGFDAGRAMALQPRMAKRVVHLVAQTEVRINFDLRSLRLPPGAKSTRVGVLEKSLRSVRGVHSDELINSPPLPEGWEERTFPGVHSDVGGGYSNGFYYPDYPILDPLPGETAVHYHRRVLDLELARGGQIQPWFMSDGPESKQIREEDVFSCCFQNFHMPIINLASSNFSKIPNILNKYFFGPFKNSIGATKDSVNYMTSMLKELERPCSQFTNYLQCPKLSPMTKDNPPPCPVLPKNATLARLPLQYMIHRAMEAGVPLTPVTKASPAVKSRIEIPQNDPLYSYVGLMYDQDAFEKAIQPSQDSYRRHIIPKMHNSRWNIDGLSLNFLPSSYFREIYYNISMEDGYQYTTPDEGSQESPARADWLTPALRAFISLTSFPAIMSLFDTVLAKYLGLIPPTNPDSMDGELSDDDVIVEDFEPGKTPSLLAPLKMWDGPVKEYKLVTRKKQ